MNESFYHGSYLYILISAAILVLLFCIRYVLKGTNKRPKVLVGHTQILGRRKEQEDSYKIVSNEKGVLAVLADGMGGFSNGKLASSTAVKTFADEFTKAPSILPIEKFIAETSRNCNTRVIENSKGENSGTTLVAVVISGGYLYWASIGDSAIVLFRNCEFINLNKKHIFQSVLEEKFIMGEISSEELKNNSYKKRLTSYIGHKGFNDIEISRKALELRKGDKIILCSDGVYNSVTEIEMERVLSKKITPECACNEIIEIIKRKNSPKQDNATIIVLEIKTGIFK
jgi:serine/threonine protein phosphatase PrpC